MQDWQEKVHPDKTESLRKGGEGKKLYDVRNAGEKHIVRHVGGYLHETGKVQEDNTKRIVAANRKIRQIGRAWMYGKQAGTKKKLPKNVRVKIMKAVVMPTLTSYGRTRYWNTSLIHQIQRTVNTAVRRCLGMHLKLMAETHVTDQMLCAMTQWEPFLNTMGRQSLLWLGHVARMDNTRLPKQTLFGWSPDYM